MSSSAKKQQKRAGVTATISMFPAMFPNTPAVSPAAPVRQRVVIERPTPPPIRRVCACCGASFDDYTRRPNTLYCRASCKNRMSEIKRNTGVGTLAQVLKFDLEAAWLIYDDQGLRYVERELNQRGYRWDMTRKGWVK